MSQLEAVVWDLDGTLVDSAPDLTSALNTVLDKRGFAGLSLTTVRGMIGNGVPKLVERGFNALGMRLDAAQLESLVALFTQEYVACSTDRTRPYPGIVEALEYIRGMNIPMGVCTNKPEALSRQILEGLGLSAYFSSVVGGDTTSTRKPDPQPLHSCLRELVAEPHASLMIGDSAVDVNTARAAGVTVGVVPWGYSRAAVVNLGADFLIHDLANLPDLLRVRNDFSQKTSH